MKNQEEIKLLFKKYLAKQCTIAEEQELLDLLYAEEQGGLFKELIDAELQQEPEPGFKDIPHIREELDLVRKQVMQQTGLVAPEPVLIRKSVSSRSFLSGRWLSVAALLLLCAGTALFFYLQNAAVEPQFSAIVPGSHKAILTLSDGSKIVLDQAAKGSLANQAGVQITKSNEGQLIYSVMAQQEGGSVAGSADLTNTISTPKGGQYQVNLPDGTKVWLNAASELKFPLSFAKLRERRVELHGEAYFEVEKDASKPFIVKSDRQYVQVLGTHFNINSYADEKETKTTLLEGSVKVSPIHGRDADQVVLKPGLQAQLIAGTKQIKVMHVDVQAEVAWKNGQFFFEDEPIENIMKQIARWYDVEIVYQDDLSGKTVWGSVTRYASVSKVLSILELTGGIHFKVEGRRITVLK
jgi:transmembrane sensor